MVTRKEIAADLRGLGFGSGDLVAVHSSLKSLGQVEGGAEAVIEAFLGVLGPTGNLLMPVFSFTFSSLDSTALYDPQRTPSRVGTVTEVFRNDPRTTRSLHPTHSVGVIGPLADVLTRDHLASSPLGRGSPFDRFRERDGTVLMIGCDLTSCSVLHLYEVLAGLPYIDIAFRRDKDHELAAISRNGKKMVGLELYEIPGCSRAFSKAEPVLERRGVLRRGRICEADCLLFSSLAAGEVMISELQKTPDLLLCDNPDCQICPRRKEAVK